MSTSTTDPIVILGAARTPMGSLQGDFSSLAAHDLGGAAIKAAIERADAVPQPVAQRVSARSRGATVTLDDE